MSRALNRLNARKISSLQKTGRHADGGGLYLRITDNGARTWVFMTSKGGKRTEIGLGASNAVTLSTARRIAGAMREATALGSDPRQVIEHEVHNVVRTAPTFREFAEDYISSIESGWRNAVHRQQWRSSLRDHASLLGTGQAMVKAGEQWFRDRNVPKVQLMIRERNAGVVSFYGGLGYMDALRIIMCKWLHRDS